MFKCYTSNDNLLLPPCLGDFIPQKDPVRVVHRIIEQINLEELYRRYSPKGCSAPTPLMILQILVYAYLRNIYSSSRIEEFCRNDIHFLWLTGNLTPYHNTINRFRNSQLKDVLKLVYHSLYGRYPGVSVCDAGYGSKENYLYTFRNGIETFIKYNYFHKEQKRNSRNNPFLSANFYYNEESDGMYCPMGQRIERLSDARRMTDNDFVQTISRYKSRNCKGCLLKCRCHRSRSERIVQVNHRLRKIKEREREKLLSDEGLKYRCQRPQDVEAVFGNLKNNKHFKRFHLHGLKKVEIEFGLLAIAHNLAKVAS